MRRALIQPWRLESLEARTLMSASERVPGEGFDLHLLSDVETDTTPVVSETNETYARVALPGGFQWYDGTSRQDLIEHGGNLPYIMVDGWNVWPRDSNGAAIRTGEPSEVNTRFLANYAVTRTDMLVIDIENWAMDIRNYSQAVVNQNIARFENIIRWIREEQPGLTIGIYSLFPVSDLYNTVQYELYSEIAADPVAGAWYRAVLPATSNAYAKLQNSNAFLSGLASKVDVVFPALYTSSTDINLWHRYAVYSVYEARRYGKPVIPFLMPTYHHAATALNRAVVAPEMWQHQLDLMPEIAEGAIIWTDELAPVGVDEYWITMAIDTINGTAGRPSSYAGDNSDGAMTWNDEDEEGDFSDTLIDELL